MSKGSFSLVNISTGTMVRFLLVISVFLIAYRLLDILLVILTAIVVASAVEPGTKWFIERRIPRVPAVILIYLATAIIFVSSFYFILLPLLSESAEFLRTLPEYSYVLSKSAETELGSGGGAFLSGFSDSFSLPSIINEVNQTFAELSSGFFSTVDVIFGGALSFLLIVVLSFYLAVQEDGVSKFLRAVVPLKQEKYVIGLWKRSQLKIGYWMQGQLVLAIIVGILVFLGLSLLQVKHALLLAVVAAVFELIPIFGSFLAAIPAILLSFIDGGLTMALIVTGFYIIIQQFESQLIYPLVVKKVVGVPPIISILALVIGAKLAGFLGIILSVPLAAVFMEFLDDFEKRKAGSQENSV